MRIVTWNNRRLTVAMISEELSIRRENVRLILTDNLEMKKIKICSRIVPKSFTEDKVHRRRRRKVGPGRSKRIEDHEED